MIYKIVTKLYNEWNVIQSMNKEWIKAKVSDLKKNDLDLKWREKTTQIKWHK